MHTHSKLKYLLLVGVLLIGIGVFWFFYFGPTAEIKKLDIRKFQGTLVGISADLVSARGVFVSLNPLPKKLQGQHELLFRVDSITEFKKLEITFPTFQSIRDSGTTTAVFDFDELPQTISVGSLEDLKKYVLNDEISIEVEFAKPIGNFKDAVASLFFYEVRIRPDENQ